MVDYRCRTGRLPTLHPGSNASTNRYVFVHPATATFTRAHTLPGVLPGYDLTHEAAFAKLLWLVSRKDLSFSKRQRIWQSPVCGEMTVGNGPGALVPPAE